MVEIIYTMIDLMFSPCSFYKQYFYISGEVVWKKVLCAVFRQGND